MATVDVDLWATTPGHSSSARSEARREVPVFLLIVTHEVEDYERFRRVFDAHPPSRGGATSHTIARAIDHPRAVTIIATFTSADRAVAWRDDPELRAALGDAGIVGVPSIAVVEEVERVDHDVP